LPSFVRQFEGVLQAGVANLARQLDGARDDAG
jgi:hypothetical protein